MASIRETHDRISQALGAASRENDGSYEMNRIEQLLEEARQLVRDWEDTYLGEYDY